MIKDFGILACLENLVRVPSADDAPKAAAIIYKYTKSCWGRVWVWICFGTPDTVRFFYLDTGGRFAKLRRQWVIERLAILTGNGSEMEKVSKEWLGE